MLLQPAGRPGLGGGVGGLSPGASSSVDEGDDISSMASLVGLIFSLANCFQVLTCGGASEAEADAEAVAADGGASGGSGGTDPNATTLGDLGDSCCSGLFSTE